MGQSYRQKKKTEIVILYKIRISVRLSGIVYEYWTGLYWQAVIISNASKRWVVVVNIFLLSPVLKSDSIKYYWCCVLAFEINEEIVVSRVIWFALNTVIQALQAKILSLKFLAILSSFENKNKEKCIRSGFQKVIISNNNRIIWISEYEIVFRYVHSVIGCFQFLSRDKHDVCSAIMTFLAYSIYLLV